MSKKPIVDYCEKAIDGTEESFVSNFQMKF